MHEGLYNASGRATPDVLTIDREVSVDLDNGSSRLQTALQAANFAGLIALFNEELASAGKPKLGFLYQNADAFNDFTTIGSIPGCGTSGLNATAGWDPTSGVGSPRYNRLREAAGL